MNENNKEGLDFSAFKPYYQMEFSKITNSEGMYRGKFNICAFLFTWMWMLSKGLIYQGIIVLAINFALTLFVGFLSNDAQMEDWATLIAPILCILINIIVGVKGNYMYYKSVVMRLPK